MTELTKACDFLCLLGVLIKNVLKEKSKNLWNKLIIDAETYEVVQLTMGMLIIGSTLWILTLCIIHRDIPLRFSRGYFYPCTYCKGNE